VKDRDGAEEDWTPTSPRKAGRGVTIVVVLRLQLTSLM
jgi:hypothetical protein